MNNYHRIVKRFKLNSYSEDLEKMHEFLNEHNDYRIVFMEQVVEDINAPEDEYYAVVVLEKGLIE